jgi:hypothetical protein
MLSGVDAPAKDFLRPVDLKLQRAAHHATALADDVGRWTSQTKLAIRHEWLDQRHGFRVVLEPFDEEPRVDQWGLTVGDWAHNLRSALDNLAYALARLHCDPPADPYSVAFPIFTERTAFERRSRRALDQMPADAADLITALQPFSRYDRPEDEPADNDAMVVLRGLNNSDKHRVPSVMVLAPEHFEHGFTVSFADEETATANLPPDTSLWDGPLAPGVVLLEHRTTDRVEHVKGQVAGTMRVAIGTPQGSRPLFDTLRSVTVAVITVCGQFRPFFGGSIITHE